MSPAFKAASATCPRKRTSTRSSRRRNISSSWAGCAVSTTRPSTVAATSSCACSTSNRRAISRSPPLERHAPEGPDLRRAAARSGHPRPRRALLGARRVDDDGAARAYQRRSALGKIVVYSSHVMDMVEKVSTRVLIVHCGRVVADNSVSALRDLLSLPSLEAVFAELTVEEDVVAIAGRLAGAMRAGPMQESRSACSAPVLAPLLRERPAGARHRPAPAAIWLCAALATPPFPWTAKRSSAPRSLSNCWASTAGDGSWFDKSLLLMLAWSRRCRHAVVVGGAAGRPARRADSRESPVRRGSWWPPRPPRWHGCLSRLPRSTCRPSSVQRLAYSHFGVAQVARSLVAHGLAVAAASTSTCLLLTAALVTVTSLFEGRWLRVMTVAVQVSALVALTGLLLGVQWSPPSWTRPRRRSRPPRVDGRSGRPHGSSGSSNCFWRAARPSGLRGAGDAGRRDVARRRVRACAADPAAVASGAARAGLGRARRDAGSIAVVCAHLPARLARVPIDRALLQFFLVVLWRSPRHRLAVLTAFGLVAAITLEGTLVLARASDEPAMADRVRRADAGAALPDDGASLAVDAALGTARELGAGFGDASVRRRSCAGPSGACCWCWALCRRWCWRSCCRGGREACLGPGARLVDAADGPGPGRARADAGDLHAVCDRGLAGRSNLRARWPIHAVVLLFVVPFLAEIERTLVAAPGTPFAVIVVLALAALGVAVYRRRRAIDAHRRSRHGRRLDAGATAHRVGMNETSVTTSRSTPNFQSSGFTATPGARPEALTLASLLASNGGRHRERDLRRGPQEIGRYSQFIRQSLPVIELRYSCRVPLRVTRREFFQAAALVGLTRKSGVRSPAASCTTRTRSAIACATAAVVLAMRRRPRVPVVIVGGGIAGLSAAWRLDGAASATSSCSRWSRRPAATRGRAQRVTATHGPRTTCPCPARAPLVRELFDELGVLADGRWDERHLCHAPQERLFLHGRWQAGFEPQVGPTARDRDQVARFESRWPSTPRRGASRSRWATRCPPRRSTAMSMAQWLAREGLDSPWLRWLVDYACRDDYGARAATRRRGPAFTTSPRARGTSRARSPGPRATAGSPSASWRRSATGCTPASRLAYRARRPPLVGLHARRRWIADAVIFAAPSFLAARVIEGGPADADFQYSPWLTANLTLDRWPSERGAPVAWDNVIVDSPSLGYVVATHQSLRTHVPQTVWTYYWALADGPPRANREWLLAQDWRRCRRGSSTISRARTRTSATVSAASTSAAWATR